MSIRGLKIRPDPACTLAIKPIPNAPRSAVVGWLGDALNVSLRALGKGRQAKRSHHHWKNHS